MTDWLNKTHVGDCRELLRVMGLDGVRVQTCVTSPPYFGLRDYGMAGQLGMESTPAAYVTELVARLSAVRDVLSDDGTLWLNLGDSYNNSDKWGRWWSKYREAFRRRPARESAFMGRRSPPLARTERLQAEGLDGHPLVRGLRSP